MTVFLHRCPRLSVLDVEGALRAPVDTALRERVGALLSRGQWRILLNLARLHDIDAAGIGELLHIYRAAKAVGGVLRIAYANGRVRRILDTAGVLRVLSET